MTRMDWPFLILALLGWLLVVVVTAMQRGLLGVLAFLGASCATAAVVRGLYLLLAERRQ